MRSRLRTTGEPRSANGASSFHLWWHLPSGPPIVEAAATLEVVVPPEVDRLHFWALQASFVIEGPGPAARRPAGAGHLGLQWHPAHPRGRAVNWGGYGPRGGELSGSGSALPSATDNPGTRDYGWSVRAPYRLRISRSRRGWRGEVTDLIGGLVTVVRDLHADGDGLADLVVWSEVFARCDHPPVVVRWSDLEAVTEAGDTVVPRSLQVTYQSTADGGCDNTDVVVDDLGALQVTATPRSTPHGAVLPWR